MNETERIIEVSGYSEPVRITWHKDPTRHLLKQKAVNAKSTPLAVEKSRPVDSSAGKQNKRPDEE